MVDSPRPLLLIAQVEGSLNSFTLAIDSSHGTGWPRADTLLRNDHLQAMLPYPPGDLQQPTPRRRGHIRQGVLPSEAQILGTCEAMIREQPHRLDVLQGGEETGSRFYVLPRIVDGGDDQHVDLDGRSPAAEPTQVTEDESIGRARVPLMALRRDVLEVVEPQVHIRQGLLDYFPLHLPTRLDSRVKTLNLTFLEKGRSKFCLQQRLPTRQGDTAPRDLVEPGVLPHHSHHIIDGDPSTSHHDGTGVTGLYTSTTEDTEASVINPLTSRSYLMDSLGTDIQTSAAGNALAGVNHDFWFRVDGLRVMTPHTSQATTLQKDRGADTGTVVDGEPLDVEDPALRTTRIRRLGRC